LLSISALFAASIPCITSAAADKAAGVAIRCNAYGTAANKESAGWQSRNGASMPTGLSGTLVNAATGKPLAGLLIYPLTDSKTTMPKDYPSTLQVKTDDKGRFAFCLPAGQYGLMAENKDGQSIPILAPGAIQHQPGIFDSNALPFFQVPPNKVLSVPKIPVQMPK
jgi:hypothetical protein